MDEMRSYNHQLETTLQEEQRKNGRLYPDEQEEVQIVGEIYNKDYESMNYEEFIDAAKLWCATGTVDTEHDKLLKMLKDKRLTSQLIHNILVKVETQWDQDIQLMQ